ncbi:MAG: 3'(2'),5'-bisphosphate nucleotidase CysQ [Acidobacteriota bacterium]|nr:MAG: 3'(2'),5'-bisphosphate nucleotidase CysQ [Acidobacteriota bacterium]
MLERELETAKKLAFDAGRVILGHYQNGFEAQEKLGADDHLEPVTIADVEASRLIVDGIAAAFLEDAILSEEEPDDVERRLSAARLWIIDPLDGTAGFVKKDGDFAVQIGLAIGGRPVLGVVHLPFHEQMYWAVRGDGAYLAGPDGQTCLSTSDITDPATMTAAVTRNHLTERIVRTIEYFGFKDVLRRGSVGLKTGLIAACKCDVYIHPSPRTKLWDTCAPQVILEEAGGRITDIFGSELDYLRRDLQNRNGIVATNGTAHQIIIDRLQPLLQEFGRKPFEYAATNA